MRIPNATEIADFSNETANAVQVPKASDEPRQSIQYDSMAGILGRGLAMVDPTPLPPD